MNEKKQATGKSEVAELISRYRAEIDRLKAQLQKAEGGKTNENPFYEGLEDVREEVEKFADEHSLGIKEAFAALYGEKKFAEVMAKNKIKQSKIPALSQSGNYGDEVQEGVLSKSEHWAAKKAGMSLADYLKYKKRGNE